MEANLTNRNSEFLSSTSKFWLWLSFVAALTGIAGSIIALSVKSIYSELTPAFLSQALAQDIANLAVVSPLWLILAVLALRGSWRAYLLWLGVLTFTVYNYVIYTFSIPFGPLFLLWVAVLGMGIYSLIGGIAAVNHKVIASFFPVHRVIRVVAWFLIITAILFCFLWLSEDVPALLSGKRPDSLAEMALPTNPVHILDLGFFLPAVIATGVMLLRGKLLAFTLAPGFIVFLILTGIPILITPVVQSLRGEAANWGILAPIGTLTVLLLALMIWFFSTFNTTSPPTPLQNGEGCPRNEAGG